MLLLNIVSFCTLFLIVDANPFDVEIRDGCDANNCLRELRASSSLARRYCHTYYTSTFTTTSTTTIPALGATFPALNKREPTPVPVATTALPSFAKSCTEIATALSSGCSCLLGPYASTTTTTVTSTSTLPLPVECSSQNSYGLYPTPLSTVVPLTQGAGGLGFDVLPGGCCAYCHASPNCYEYYELLDYVAAEPGMVGCSIGILGDDDPVQPLGIASCPFGTATFSFGPVETSVLYGAGPCATVISTV